MVALPVTIPHNVVILRFTNLSVPPLNAPGLPHRRMHDDGFNRIMLHHQPADDRTFVRTAAGKAVQRMIELDKYRMLALMVRPGRSCPPRHPTRSVPSFLG